MTDTQDTIKKLTDITEEVMKAHGLKNRPNGPIYCLVVLEIAHEVILDTTLSELTDEVLDLLTDNNMHTTRQACELAIDLLMKEGQIDQWL